MKIKTLPDSKKNTACRYCNSENLVRFLSLGDQPPSNSFIPAKDIVKEKKYPLVHTSNQ